MDNPSLSIGIALGVTAISSILYFYISSRNRASETKNTKMEEPIVNSPLEAHTSSESLEKSTYNNNNNNNIRSPASPQQYSSVRTPERLHRSDVRGRSMPQFVQSQNTPPRPQTLDDSALHTPTQSLMSPLSQSSPNFSYSPHPNSPVSVDRRRKSTARECSTKHEHQKTDHFGTTTKMWLKGRSYVFHTPAAPEETIPVPLPLVIFLHGRNGNAWRAAIDETTFRIRSRNLRYYVAFPQGSFVDKTVSNSNTNTDTEKAPEEANNRYESTGNHIEEGSWRYRDPGWKEDLEFIEDMVDEICKNQQICRDKIFLVGFCDGGLFASVFAIKSDIPQAVCVLSGGLEEAADVPVPATSDEKKKRVMIITGPEDAHLQSSNYANEKFLAAGYPTTFIKDLPLLSEGYNSVVEPAIFSFFDMK